MIYTYFAIGRPKEKYFAKRDHNCTHSKLQSRPEKNMSRESTAENTFGDVNSHFRVLKKEPDYTVVHRHAGIGLLLVWKASSTHLVV
jgi:hypothetical protein